MQKHIELIDGQEVVVKVYEPKALPRRVSARLKPGSLVRKKKQKKQRIFNT